MEKTLELWHISSKASELKEVPSESPKDNEVVIESVFSMVSPGTERTVCLGNVPEEVGENMRVPHMKGFFSFPCTFGYSLVGMVLQGPDNLVGKLVHLVHPHQSLITVNQSEIYPIPGFIPAKRATLASNLESAITAIWDSGISAGDKILITGFGIIGALIARLAEQIPGVDILVLEKEQGRATLAASMGFKVLSTTRRMGNNYDLAFNTSGTSRGLQACIDALGTEGKVIETSWYGSDAVNLKLGMGFHYKRKQIISSQDLGIPASKKARWDHKRRKDLAFSMLKDESYDDLITMEVPFKSSPDFFKRLRNEDMNDIGIVFSYR
jgi:2-desacetyl-2-hydroxyethyl bacteriochlorophyllide A dehydrogenase